MIRANQIYGKKAYEENNYDQSVECRRSDEKKAFIGSKSIAKKRQGGGYFDSYFETEPRLIHHQGLLDRIKHRSIRSVKSRSLQWRFNQEYREIRRKISLHHQHRTREKTKFVLNEFEMNFKLWSLTLSHFFWRFFSIFFLLWTYRSEFFNDVKKRI